MRTIFCHDNKINVPGAKLYYTNALEDKYREYIPKEYIKVKIPEYEKRKIQIVSNKIRRLYNLDYYKVKILVEGGFMYWDVANVDIDHDSYMLTTDKEFFKAYYKYKMPMGEIIHLYGLEHLITLKLI